MTDRLQLAIVVGLIVLGLAGIVGAVLLALDGSGDVAAFVGLGGTAVGALGGGLALRQKNDPSGS